MEREFNCVIIDDEMHAVELLTDYISAMPNLHLIKCFTDPLRAMVDIGDADDIDIVFMDIDMPGMSGLDLSQAIRHKTKYLVFTTAHAKYAIDAFSVQANEYLLKPISMSKFALMVNRLVTSELAVKKEVKTEDFFFVKTDQTQRYTKVNLRDLIAVEGLNNYIKIHTPTGTYIAYLTMKEMESKLEGNENFMRVQRSFIISMDHINKVEASTIILSNKLEVPLGTTYKKSFLNFLERNTIRSTRNISE